MVTLTFTSILFRDRSHPTPQEFHMSQVVKEVLGTFDVVHQTEYGAHQVVARKEFRGLHVMLPVYDIWRQLLREWLDIHTVISDVAVEYDFPFRSLEKYGGPVTVLNTTADWLIYERMDKKRCSSLVLSTRSSERISRQEFMGGIITFHALAQGFVAGAASARLANDTIALIIRKGHAPEASIMKLVEIINIHKMGVYYGR